jgi:hypothetical protein
VRLRHVLVRTSRPKKICDKGFFRLKNFGPQKQEENKNNSTRNVLRYVQYSFRGTDDDAGLQSVSSKDKVSFVMHVARDSQPLLFLSLCSRIFLSHKIFLGKSVFCRKKFEKEKRHIRGKYIPSLHKYRAAQKLAVTTHLKTPAKSTRAHLFAILFFFFSLFLSPFFVSLKEDREID